MRDQGEILKNIELKGQIRDLKKIYLQKLVLRAQTLPPKYQKSHLSILMINPSHLHTSKILQNQNKANNLNPANNFS